MADMNATAARPGLTPTIWDSDFFSEYVRDSPFSEYFGTDENAMIHLRYDLTRKNGDTIVFPTVRRLVGAGVTGNTVLEGNEELLDARSLALTVGVIRHAVAVSEWDEQKSVIDLRMAARSALKTWAMEKMRNDIIAALGHMTADADVALTYAAATAGQRNTWLVNNTDRVLFGAAVANHVSGVMATSLTTLDTTADKMTGSILSTAKRRAKLASPHIRPIKIDRHGEWFVCFMPSYVFRDFKLDPVIIAAQQYANVRGSDNPLFSNGDLLWDGVIVKEVPELTVIANAGSGGTTDVARSYLCGAQALGIGWAQRTKSVENQRDYRFFNGVGISEIRTVGKLRWGTDATTDKTTPKDHGLFTIFTTAVADS